MSKERGRNRVYKTQTPRGKARTTGRETEEEEGKTKETKWERQPDRKRKGEGRGRDRTQRHTESDRQRAVGKTNKQSDGVRRREEERDVERRTLEKG